VDGNPLTEIDLDGMEPGQRAGYDEWLVQEGYPPSGTNKPVVTKKGKKKKAKPEGTATT
jgi:hypothetical protein